MQLSLRSDLDPQAHLAAGRALAPLRDEGVLIIGSGNTYHNMRVMMRAMRGGGSPEPSGREFDRWLSHVVTHADPAERDAMLAAWDNAPGARDANPREEHLIPLHVAAGAAGDDRGVKTLEDHVMGAVESAFRFG
jgi:aromatic ring-opening dioxygenase catalytic subunit (LigB family)